MKEAITIGIIGAGLMGTGIAVQFARQGYPVVVQDISGERLQQLPIAAGGIIDELIAAGQVPASARRGLLEKLQPAVALDALKTADFAIEAAPEILPVKQAIYQALERILRPEVVISSNTSGFLPDPLAAGLRDPSRFLVTHFWNPPHAIPLVEVVPGTRTAPETVAQAVRLLSAIRMEPVVLEKAIPGFIGNRLQFAILREALHIVQSGAATAEEVDRVMKASLGRRYRFMGPFEVADQGGLDTFLAISQHLMPALARDESVLDLLRQKVAANETGARTGIGFYQWTPERQQQLLDARRRELFGKMEAGEDDASA